MALYALPTILENRFADYIRANYSGSYNVTEAFTKGEYALPLIMVKAGKFVEKEPFTNVFEGSVSIAIVTQLDDVNDAVTIHDNTVATVYDAIVNRTALLASLNATGGKCHVWQYFITSYDNDRDGRDVKSMIELFVSGQTLEVA